MEPNNRMSEITGNLKKDVKDLLSESANIVTGFFKRGLCTVRAVADKWKAFAQSVSSAADELMKPPFIEGPEAPTVSLHPAAEPIVTVTESQDRDFPVGKRMTLFSLYGLTGWEAFWQNWLTDVAPFPWTQGQITVIAIITSLLGSLFFAQIVILVSSISKNQFVSIVISATILLFPMFDFAFTNSSFINMLYNFLPTRIMMGIRIWQGYDLFYFVGHTVPYQYIAIIFAVIVSVCICPLTVHSFIKHQVGNK